LSVLGTRRGHDGWHHGFSCGSYPDSLTNGGDDGEEVVVVHGDDWGWVDPEWIVWHSSAGGSWWFVNGRGVGGAGVPVLKSA